MVDEVRVGRLLRAITEELAFLSAETGAGPARRNDRTWLRAVKYGFVTAIEACLDVAQHLCASEGWGPPSTNADALVILGRHGVLEPDLARRLALAVGFRNALVHGYVAVDDAVVLRRLDHLGEFEDFVAAVAGWMSRQP
ncbi:type VII toxin-antitoxin system HepT family RNase toxin [Actinomycetospora cinnamomea]|uniref:Uncharacterized protein YutE (UPF0331/DUF86 family) n=1 Tax=Actinomycetospora cinnamomea TaxID=663609 RepID=A0A2U1EVH3_9PSEU|nr:DUF86 domain-containing protein [Actinomycetospora cinnamomea]PVZ03943.1 uncharacterized protein YutE (UPF0331/DUF86 family) [Actinomycetospora cinnamomea]